MRLRHLLLTTTLGAAASAAELAVEASPPAPAKEVSFKAMPCRPTIACNAEFLGKDVFEVETGYSVRSNGDTTGTGQSAQLLLKYSMTDRVQLQLGTNGVFTWVAGAPVQFMDGVIPGIKAWLAEQGTVLPSVAFSLHATVPTASSAAALQKTIDAAGWLYLSKDVGRLHADLNFALNVFDLVNAPAPQGLVALALSYDLGRGWGVMTEWYTNTNGTAAVAADGGWLNAVSFSPIEEIVFDLGGDLGFFHQTRVFTLFAGVTFVPHSARPSAAVVAQR